MKLFAVLLLIFGINGQLQAAIDAVYDGNNGIRSQVLTVCMQCHSTSLTGAARNNAPSPPNFNTYADAILLGDQAVSLAVGESMPPQGYPRLSSEQKAALLAWQAAGFPEKSASVSDCLFNWAETGFPDVFAPRTQSLSATPYYYRFYPPATYLAIASNRLLYLGPLTANTVLDLGDVATWYPKAGCN